MEASTSLTAHVPSAVLQTVPGRDYGTLVPVDYYSDIAQKQKSAFVLLPHGYDEGVRYPVLYVNHGIFGDRTSMLDDDYGLLVTAGNLMAQGEAEQMLLVFPSMYTSRDTDACTGFTPEETERYDAFREDLTECLMPCIRARFSVKEGRAYTGISGFSMGGRESLYIGLTRPEVFGYIGACCPAPGVTPCADMRMAHPGNMPESELWVRDPQPYLLLVAGGGADDVVTCFPRRYHEILTANGQPHLWMEVPGGRHDGSSVAPVFYNFFRMVFKA